jgi:HEAT repeat protein
LPPVEPPSSGFIVQLFLIPAAVVGVVILVWLLFGKLAGGERDANDYIETIRSGNDKRRWRAAYELASLIGNDEKLAADSQLLGQLTDLLNHELGSQSDPQLKVYLTVALGAFQTLDARSPSGQPIRPLDTLCRALAAKQPGEVRRAAAESLAKQAARLQGTLTDSEAIAALADAAKDTEPELRKRATYALGFFGGDQAVAALRGRLSDEDRDVRYNAAMALGRRGDVTASTVLREMLSTADLNQVIAAETESEKQSQIETIEVNALRSLETALRAGESHLAETLRSQVIALSKSNLASVRLEAESVLKSLPAKTAEHEPSKTTPTPP